MRLDPPPGRREGGPAQGGHRRRRVAVAGSGGPAGRERLHRRRGALRRLRRARPTCSGCTTSTSPSTRTSRRGAFTATSSARMSRGESVSGSSTHDLVCGARDHRHRHGLARERVGRAQPRVRVQAAEREPEGRRGQVPAREVDARCRRPAQLSRCRASSRTRRSRSAGPRAGTAARRRRRGRRAAGGAGAVAGELHVVVAVGDRVQRQRARDAERLRGPRTARSAGRSPSSVSPPSPDARSPVTSRRSRAAYRCSARHALVDECASSVRSTPLVRMWRLAADGQLVPAGAARRPGRGRSR